MSNHININVNNHSSIQIDDLFFDPFKTENVEKKAKYIFLTHTHYDHLSIEDIDRVITPETIIFATYDAKEQLEKYSNKIIYVKPNEKFEIDNLEIETIPSYNLNKDFHKKEYNWVGYKITKDGISYVIPGDTDATPELQEIECDILFVPIGGTYTMSAEEAATLTNKIMPKLVIPMHYASIVGTPEDAQVFLDKIDENIICKIFF